MKPYRVVFHLDEDSVEKANEVFNNIRNLLADMGEENVEVELLANGKGVAELRKGSEANAIRIRHLASQGVQFAACANSLRFLRIPVEELVGEVVVVPAGVSELVRKQAEGWAYIRP